MICTHRPVLPWNCFRTCRGSAGTQPDPRPATRPIRTGQVIVVEAVLRVSTESALRPMTGSCLPIRVSRCSACRNIWRTVREVDQAGVRRPLQSDRHPERVSRDQGRSHPMGRAGSRTSSLRYRGEQASGPSRSPDGPIRSRCRPELTGYRRSRELAGDALPPDLARSSPSMRAVGAVHACTFDGCLNLFSIRWGPAE